MNDGDRVLIAFAFACDPDSGSEPGAGWAIVRAASPLFARVVVVTRAPQTDGLRAAAAALGNIEVVALTTGVEAARSVYLRYAFWVLRAGLWARRRLRSSTSPTVVHHVTYASDWMLSPIAFIRRGRGPVVWGPVGGATYPPSDLLRGFPRRFQSAERWRRLLTTVCRSVTLPVHRRTASVAVAMNADTSRELRGFARHEVRTNFITPPDVQVNSDGAREPVVIFAGRPLEWKGIRLVLSAMRESQGHWALELYGGTVEEFSAFGDVSSERVSVHGRVPRSDLLERLAQVGALVLPSLHDSGGWVAAEAAAMGTPVICLDLGGVSVMAGELAETVECLPSETLPARLASRIDAVLATGGRSIENRNPPDWSAESFGRALEHWYAA